MFVQRGAKKGGKAVNQFVDVDDLRGQWLAPGESQQPARQLRRPFRRAADQARGSP